MPEPRSTVDHRTESGDRLPILVWRFDQAVRAISSSALGGGLGERHWWVNATVGADYGRTDPDVHLNELAAGLGLAGEGVGMLTAVDANRCVTRRDGGVVAAATVGLGHPTWAAAPDGDLRTWRPGTINIAVWVPVRLSDAALVNAVVTLTEAKAQALAECAVSATGTGSDAVCVACPIDGSPELFAGPRSTWGARLARAVHSAVVAGTRDWLHAPADFTGVRSIR